MDTSPSHPTYEDAKLALEQYDWRHHWRDRLVCAFRGHDDFDPVALIASGPATAPPDERHYSVAGFVVQCRFCHRCQVMHPDSIPGAAHDLLAERRQDDWMIWDDDDSREQWLEMHRELRLLADTEIVRDFDVSDLFPDE